VVKLYVTEILLHAILAKQRFNAGRYTIVGHGGVHVSADMSYASCLAQLVGWSLRIVKYYCFALTSNTSSTCTAPLYLQKAL